MVKRCSDCKAIVSDKKWKRHMKRCARLRFRKEIMHDIKKSYKRGKRIEFVGAEVTNTEVKEDGRVQETAVSN